MSWSARIWAQIPLFPKHVFFVLLYVSIFTLWSTSHKVLYQIKTTLLRYPKCIQMERERAHLSLSHPMRYAQQPHEIDRQEELASCPFLWLNKETAGWCPKQRILLVFFISRSLFTIWQLPHIQGYRMSKYWLQMSCSSTCYMPLALYFFIHSLARSPTAWSIYIKFLQVHI